LGKKTILRKRPTNYTNFHEKTISREEPEDMEKTGRAEEWKSGKKLKTKKFDFMAFYCYIVRCK